MTDSLYAELGVRPVIHCAGTKTTMGGSRLAPEVLEAMAEASRRFVPVAELNRRIGEYIAGVTGAEAGMVTSGAASGVVLSIAACMTGTDAAKVKQLPDATGMPDELVIQKVHRGKYSHMYTFTGARFVEVGNVNECDAEEVEHAIGPRTAAVAYLEGPGIVQVGPSLAETAEIAHRHGVPVIVDAAAMLPPRSNLRRYVDEGADLVTFSGGKLIHGPQNTGLLYGRRDLVEAAFANASPNHAIGRPHKVSREDMVGLYVALKRYMELDEDELLGTYRKRLEPLAAQLAGLADVDVSIRHDPVRFHVPTLVVSIPPHAGTLDGRAVARRLFEGDPRIFVPWDRARRELSVNPISLQDDEVAEVGRRLLRELGG